MRLCIRGTLKQLRRQQNTSTTERVLERTPQEQI